MVLYPRVGGFVVRLGGIVVMVVKRDVFLAGIHY
jgi:hypothetical protein